MRLRACTLGLASVLVLAACAQEQPPVDTSADVAAIRAWVDQFVDAWNRGDKAAISPLVAQDAVLMQPDGPPHQGRAAILATMGEPFDFTMVQQSATTDEVVVIGDYAYGRGTWKLDPTPAAGPDVQPANGKWSVVFKRGADGAWEVWRWMWNQPAPEMEG